jgi:hypothetical protein
MYIKKNSKEVSDFVVVIVGMELASAHPPPHSPFALSSSFFSVCQVEALQFQGHQKVQSSCHNIPVPWYSHMISVCPSR